MTTKFTDEVLNKLIGYAVRRDGEHVFKLSGEINGPERTLEEVLLLIEVESPSEFIEALSDYLVGHIQEGTEPVYLNWCSGTCCSSVLTQMIIECEKLLNKDSGRLAHTIIRKLKTLPTGWDKDLALRCFSGLFRDGYNTIRERRMERFSKLISEEVG